MTKRTGVVGIVITEPKEVSERVNLVISKYSSIIIGRMGVPKHEEHIGIVALIVEGSTDDIGALTGKLGNIPGVIVKSALTAQRTAISKGENEHD